MVMRKLTKNLKNYNQIQNQLKMNLKINLLNVNKYYYIYIKGNIKSIIKLKIAIKRQRNLLKRYKLKQ